VLPFLANTADFLAASGVRLGLLYPAKLIPRYLILPLGVRFTCEVVAIYVFRDIRFFGFARAIAFPVFFANALAFFIPLFVYANFLPLTFGIVLSLTV
tara:strand:- start:1044 stop:1337 length:294 start_codon:yes stop_codon:yes gene_type:complete